MSNTVKIKKQDYKELEGQMFRRIDTVTSPEILFMIGYKPWYYTGKSFRLHSLAFDLGLSDLEVQIIEEKDMLIEVMECKMFDDDGIQFFGEVSHGLVEMNDNMRDMLKLAKSTHKERQKVGWKPSKEHTKEMEQRTLLEEYSKWLEKHGYMDTDWWQEEPKAIDEFMEEKKTQIDKDEVQD